MPSNQPYQNLTDRYWAKSFAKQALSDLRAREILADKGVEKCHRLHFLQMAAEKTCKAHLVTASGHENVRRSHAYVEGTLPIIARHFYSISKGNQAKPWELAEIKKLAHEIELLAPACDEGDTRRDNTEYPWESANGEIRTPCDYNFPKIDDRDRSIVGLIKLIRTAAESYSK